MPLSARVIAVGRKEENLKRNTTLAMGNIYIYQTSPNQRSIITKKTLSNKDNPYAICNTMATLTAAKELTDRAFKLYIRMSLHQDGHTYA